MILDSLDTPTSSRILVGATVRSTVHPDRRPRRTRRCLLLLHHDGTGPRFERRRLDPDHPADSAYGTDPVLIKDQGGNIREFAGGYVAEITLSVKSVTFIRKLARAIGQTTGRGKRYANPNWKWICPRTAASLERLADALISYRTERSSNRTPR